MPGGCHRAPYGRRHRRPPHRTPFDRHVGQVEFAQSARKVTRPEGSDRSPQMLAFPSIRIPAFRLELRNEVANAQSDEPPFES